MGCCVGKATLPVARRRLYPTLTADAVNRVISADVRWKAVLGQAVAAWRRLCAKRMKAGMEGAERVGRALGKGVLRGAFARVRRKGWTRSRVGPLCNHLAKRVKLTLERRLRDWRNLARSLTSRQHTLLRLGQTVLPHLRAKYRLTISQLFSRWHSQVLRAVSIQSQSRKLALRELTKVVKGVAWRDLKMRLRLEWEDTEVFRAVGKIGRFTGTCKLRTAVQVWKRASAARTHSFFVQQQLHTVSLSRYLKRYCKHSQRLAFSQWQLYRDWRGLANSSVRLSGTDYSQLGSNTSALSRKTVRVGIFSPISKPSPVALRLEKIDLVRKTTEKESNREEMKVVRTAFGRHSKKIAAKVAAAFSYWKGKSQNADGDRLHFLRKTHYFWFLLQNIRKNRLLEAIQRLKSEEKKRLLGRAIRILTKNIETTLRKCIFQWKMNSKIKFPLKSSGISAIFSLLQRFFTASAFSHTLFVFNKPVYIATGLVTLERRFKCSFEQWFQRWGRNSVHRLAEKRVSDLRKVRVRGLVRDRMQRNVVFFFRLFVKRVQFGAKIGRFLSKRLGMKEKTVKSLAMRRMQRRVKQLKVVPMVWRVVQQGAEDLLLECLERWRAFVQEAKMSTPRASYYSSFKSLFRR